MIRIVDADGVRTITLDRPEKRNALTSDMLSELGRAFASAAGVRACVLLGAGPVFCSGFDLKEQMADEKLSALRAQLTQLAATIKAMRAAACPVVVGVQGAAIAGGCALLGGAAAVIADRGAKLGYPVVRLGISPAVTAPFLRLRVGDGAARALLLDPGLIGAERALAIGLVDALVDDARHVHEAAQHCAMRLASKPRGAMDACGTWLSALAPARIADRALQVSLDAIGDETVDRLKREIWSR
ncbi:MAG: enoyl-CoA hydratase/isomerase family protein [Phycisphaerales bacterium]